MQNPIKLIFRALGLWLKGRLRFERISEGEQLEIEGESFKVFRKVIVTPPKNGDTLSGAIFEVQFRFKNLSVPANRLLSLIPIPLIVAQPGFRSKTWLLGQEIVDFIGYYEFETVETAKEYWNSLPLRMMRRRAAKGSLNHVVRSK